jgi:hypothetical protein
LYVRSTASAADVFVALGSPKADRTAVFDYDLPPGFTVADGIPGFKNFYSAQGDYLGSVKQGNTKDSAGNTVPTTLDFSATTITQKAQPTSATAYPLVMAAPSWVYNFEFPPGYGNNVEPARALGRNGGRPYKMTPAKLRLSMASMGKPGTKVSGLCAELCISRQTLYRHVSPTGELRPDGEKLLSK